MGDFRIRGQIGRGGMGVVYEADQISMGRRVALKVLPLAGLVDDVRIQRFQNEVRAVAALNHPHIVSVYMVGEERGVHYYADTIDRAFYRSVVSLGVQAAEALHHAHDQGVIHRDIKPGNLLLDRSTKLFVTDFGLARVGADAGVTMTGDLVGTLGYMAPEQALAQRVVVDGRADVYSLGVTFTSC